MLDLIQTLVLSLTFCIFISIELFSLTEISVKFFNKFFAVNSSFLENFHLSIPREAP